MTTAQTRRNWGAAVGLLAGAALDRAVPDPRVGHPVALYGRASAVVQRRMHGHSRARGGAFVLAAVAPVTALGAAAEWRAGPARRALATAAATWTALGGAMLGREAGLVARALERGDLDAARRRLPHLCGRDPDSLDSEGIARAAVESVAENTSDAVVAPLLWGAVLGVPGLLGYRAINTLDAMVGHRSPRYTRFGWAAARLDDVVNWAPARTTAALATALAPVIGGSPSRARRVAARDGGRHPSPNAGHCEAAFAGALDVRLGGTNAYAGQVDHRPELGRGARRPGPGDIRRAVRLARVVNVTAAALAALTAAALPGRAPRTEPA